MLLLLRHLLLLRLIHHDGLVVVGLLIWHLIDIIRRRNEIIGARITVVLQVAFAEVLPVLHLNPGHVESKSEKDPDTDKAYAISKARLIYNLIQLIPPDVDCGTNQDV